MLKHSVRVSRFVRPLTIELEKPVYFLHQNLTGRTLRVSKDTLRFFRIAKKHSPLSPTFLKKYLDSKSKSTLELFLKEGIFVREKEELLWSRYPVFKGAVSFENPQGQREILIPEWKGSHYTFRSFIPDSLSWEILSQSQGKKTLEEIYRKLDKRGLVQKKNKHQFLRLVETLLSPRLQLLRFSQKPLRTIPYELFHSPLHSFQHPKHIKKRKQKESQGGVVQLESFHKNYIEDAFQEFDHVEITVSHAFRKPNLALGGISYGAAFFDAFQKLSVRTKKPKILEVGGGTGIFSKAFIDRTKEKSFPIESYEIFDLSPALQRSQKKIHKESKRIRFQTGNAENFHFKKATYDWILSNEVVADFTTVQLEKVALEEFRKNFSHRLNRSTAIKERSSLSAEASQEAMELICCYDIPVDDAPETFFFNLGTARFLQNIFRSLRKGGMAILVEFGGKNTYPTPTTHLNHDEYSIHWGQMSLLAKKLGFQKVKVQELTSFLPFDPKTPLLSSDVYCVQEIFKRHKKEFPLLAYDQASWKEMEKTLSEAKILGVEFSPLQTGRHWGPIPQGFQVLVLQK